MLTIIVFIIILGVLVLIHELGHFLMAKKTGVLVEEFGFGLPPRVWGKKIGETIYSINLLFFGGFVKLFGEEYQELKGVKQNINRSFVSKKPHQKTLIVLSGVFMNIFLAVVIYYALLAGNNFQSEPLPLFNNYKFRFGEESGRVVVTNVVKGSPAFAAGVNQEDIVMRFKIDGGNWTEIQSGQQLIKDISKFENIPVTIDFYNLKNGVKKTLVIRPVYDKKLKRAVIGIQMIDSVIIAYQTPGEKIFSGFLHSYNITAYNLKTFAYFFQTAYRQKNIELVSESVSGPIGIFAVIADLVKTSGNKFFINLLNIIAALSLSLAIMNVLPFPALDGGRLIFILYEWITGKHANPKIEYYVNLVGFCLLIGLAILISFNDIMRFIK